MLDIAKAIKMLMASSVDVSKCNKVVVVDSQGNEVLIVPDLIIKITSKVLYNPDRRASRVSYVNGDAFVVDLEPSSLNAELGFTTKAGCKANLCIDECRNDLQA